MGSEIHIEVCQYCFPSHEDWAATVSLTPFIRHAITTANGYQEIVGNFALTIIRYHDLSPSQNHSMDLVPK